MKLIKKDKLTFKAGHLIKKNKVVGLPVNVWLQLNELETMIQQYDYLKKQKEYNPGPSLDGFERKRSEYFDNILEVLPPETPVSDKRTAEAMAFMKEVDQVDKANEVNKTIERFRDLMLWCQHDEFIEGDCYNPIDLYVIGNPLELTEEQVAQFIERMVFDPVQFSVSI